MIKPSKSLFFVCVITPTFCFLLLISCFIATMMWAPESGGTPWYYLQIKIILISLPLSFLTSGIGLLHGKTIKGVYGEKVDKYIKPINAWLALMGLYFTVSATLILFIGVGLLLRIPVFG